MTDAITESFMYSSSRFAVECIIKLSLSVVCSTIISIERELHTHPGGVATHTLVGLASCLFTMLSVYMRDRYPAPNADPARICAQIVNGMGFLGSATVYKSNNYVKGINTAANLWISAAISMAIGAGLWEFAFITALMTAGVLAANNVYKKRLYQSMQSKQMAQGDLDDDAEGESPCDEYVDLENLTSHMGTLAAVNRNHDDTLKSGRESEGGYLEMAKLTRTVRDLLATDGGSDQRNVSVREDASLSSVGMEDKNFHGKNV